MPANGERAEWEIVAEGLTDDSYTRERLNRMCCSSAYVKRTQLCQICPGDHEMDERRLRCTSVTCVAHAVPTGTSKPRCSKIWNVWQCSVSRSWKILTKSVEHARGEASCEGAHRPIITAEMRKYIGDMDETGLAPRHIWSRMRRNPAAPPINGQPSYKQVARCVKLLRAKHGERNSVESIRSLVRKFPYYSGIDADKAFLFGPAVDDQGFPSVGNGEDHNSFVMGVTTLRLLEKMKQFQQDNLFALFHLDATFKLSEIGYPVITCGFSDRSREYHLVAMFVVSRLTQAEYAAALSSLIQQYQRQFGALPKVDAVLGDAEDAQYNALQHTSSFQGSIFLMCFFHVLYNVRKRTRQLDNFLGAMVYKGVIAMYYTSSLLEFYETRDTILTQWRAYPALRSFADYFETQWLNSRYWRWQVFHAPTGYATTNNPCETFNASIKRHVMRKLLDTQRLLRKLTDICEDVTADNFPVKSTYGNPPSSLVTAARKLVRAKHVVMFKTADPDVVRVVQLRGFNGVLTS